MGQGHIWGRDVGQGCVGHGHVYGAEMWGMRCGAGTRIWGTEMWGCVGHREIWGRETYMGHRDVGQGHTYGAEMDTYGAGKHWGTDVGQGHMG